MDMDELKSRLESERAKKDRRRTAIMANKNRLTAGPQSTLTSEQREELAAEYVLRELREYRVRKRNNLRRRYEAVIPPAFGQKARMASLSAKFALRLTSVAPPRGIYLHGPIGSGKSFALCALARTWLAAGEQVCRLKWDQVCMEIRATYNGAGGSDIGIIERLGDVDRLIIEDLGTKVALGRQESDFTVSVFWLILDNRVEFCRPTYITSNKSLEEIRGSFDDRIFSRILGHCEVIRIAGRDKRLTQD
jgi:DNA replication protein DnaC